MKMAIVVLAAISPWVLAGSFAGLKGLAILAGISLVMAAIFVTLDRATHREAYAPARGVTQLHTR